MNTSSIKNTIRLASLVLGLMIPSWGFSQDSSFGNWMIYIGNKKINPKWNLHHEVQYRNYNAIGDLEQLLLRTGLGYTFNEKKNNALLGYGYILSENYIANSDDKFSIKEHRIFQQFTSTDVIKSVKLNHRYRFEQRFVENDFKMRFRYFLGLNIFLTSKGKDNNNFYLSVYNEIFLNTQSSVFDRNRTYGGIGYQMGKNLKVELGYLNQFFETSSRDQFNIITFLSF